MPGISPFHRWKEREEQQPLERRLGQIEYALALLPGQFEQDLTALTESVDRLPNDAIVEAPAASLTLSEEVSTSVTLGTDDTFTELDTSGGPIVATLPAASSATGPLYVKVVGPNRGIVRAQAGELIDAEAEVALARQWTAVMLVSNGTGWRIYGMYLPAETLSPLLWAALIELRKVTLHLASMSGEEVTDADVASGEEL